MKEAQATLVTGLPDAAARRLVRQLLDSEADRVFVLCSGRERAAAERLAAALPAAARERLRLLDGEAGAMDLGLAGPEYRALAGELTTIHHTAALTDPTTGRLEAERVHIGGTRVALDLATEAPRLRRFVAWSTALVAGGRAGVILEEELDCGQRFRSALDETRFDAERLVRNAMHRMPITVLRPALVVGDSRTGLLDEEAALERPSGAQALFAILVRTPIDMPLPLPGRAEAPLNVVPIDFVVDAALLLAADPAASGGTFHLTDPNPLAARTVCELVAGRAGRRAPRGAIPTGLARALASGIERFAGVSRSLVDSLNQVTIYNCRHTLTRLEGTGVRCPPFDSYVDALVQVVRARAEALALERRKASAGAADGDDSDPLLLGSE